MSRYWADTDGHGNKLTDGRVCLVIEPDDPALPTIRTYGRDKDEVLDKVAHTAETAQSTITRLRSSQVQPSPQVSPASPAVAAPNSTRRRLTADEQAQATADLSNPAKSPAAVRALLREAGVDVDQMQIDAAARRVSVVAQEWERQHPDFPHSERNQRLLIDKAILKVGFPNITAETLDAAYNELLSLDMLFEADGVVTTPPVPPDGSPDSRTNGARTRNATSYRSNALRSAVPAVAPKTPKYTRAQIDAMNSAVYREKLRSEPGFADCVNQLSAATA